MDLFPLDLVLAVAVASATSFFGSLPTRNIASSFFERQTLRATVAWIIVALAAPPTIIHYYFFISLLCLAAWWQFRHDHAFSGKIWLAIASALGISLGVILILAVTPRVYPPEWTQTAHTLLLASIYLGGAIPGFAYAIHSLMKDVHSNISNDWLQRYLRLLMVLVLARALVGIVGSVILPGIAFRSGMHSMREIAENALHRSFFLIHHPVEFKTAITLIGIALPYLVFSAWRAIRSGRQRETSRTLIAIVLVGLITEILVQSYL